jgi:hypothetical protein
MRENNRAKGADHKSSSEILNLGRKRLDEGLKLFQLRMQTLDFLVMGLPKLPNLITEGRLVRTNLSRKRS